MRLPHAQFTVRRQMAFVTTIAVGLMTARHVFVYRGPSEAMALAPIVLVATNVLAWFERARWQVFRIELCGWAYLTFSLGSPPAEYLPTA